MVLVLVTALGKNTDICKNLVCVRVAGWAGHKVRTIITLGLHFHVCVASSEPGETFSDNAGCWCLSLPRIRDCICPHNSPVYAGAGLVVAGHLDAA